MLLYQRRRWAKPITVQILALVQKTIWSDEIKMMTVMMMMRGRGVMSHRTFGL